MQDPPLGNQGAIVAVEARSEPGCTCGNAYVWKNKCGLCAWNHMHDDWRRTLSEMHDPQTCPIIRTPNDQPFAVGCVLCKSHSTERKKDPWANFRISSKSNLQIGHMKRHVQSRLHREACKKLGIKLIEQLDRDDRVPKASSWLWSLTTCFTYASMLDYEKFLQCDDAVKLGLTGAPDMSPVWTGNKRRTGKQITTCIGSVIDDHEQSLMRSFSSSLN